MKRSALIFLAALGIVAASLTHATELTPTAQQDTDPAPDADLAPADPKLNMLLLQPLADGGLQRVTTTDPDDNKQIALIQRQLEEQAVRFSQGDFSDPTKVHGHHMPGLAELAKGDRRIKISYSPLPNGAEIRYQTEDLPLVNALHEWFRWQAYANGQQATRRY